MQSVSMQDLEQFSYWQKKCLTSSHWYLTLMSMSHAMDYRPWVPYENILLCLITSGRTVATTLNKMFRGANEYSSLCFLSIDSAVITNIISDDRLAKLSLVDGSNTITMH